MSISRALSLIIEKYLSRGYNKDLMVKNIRGLRTLT